jgi:hypothetical protein
MRVGLLDQGLRAAEWQGFKRCVVARSDVGRLWIFAGQCGGIC